LFLINSPEDMLTDENVFYILVKNSSSILDIADKLRRVIFYPVNDGCFRLARESLGNPKLLPGSYGFVSKLSGCPI